MIKKSNHENLYQIRIKERLNFSLANWMDDISVIPQENGETLLVGQFIDQSALRGLLDQLWNRNFTVLAVEIINKTNDDFLTKKQIED